MYRSKVDDKVINDIYYFCFKSQYQVSYTTSETPSVGDTAYRYDSTLNIMENDRDIEAFVEGTPLGTGVIYRLIDEWNNDVAYDFKNIQFIRPLTDEGYDADNGTDTWVYTFTAYDIDNIVCLDCSMINGRDNIVNETEICVNNTIKAYINSAVKYKLSNNAVIMILSEVNEEIPSCMELFIDSGSNLNTIGYSYSLSLINCTNCSFDSNSGVEVRFLSGKSIQGEDNAIFIYDKKVLTES